MLRAIRPALLAATLALAGWASTGLSAPGAHAGGGACHQPPELNDASGDVIELTRNCFSPTVLRVQPGTEVLFRNQDEVTHHLSGVALQWGTEPGPALGTGGSRTVVFAEPGIFPYSCYLHVGMTGVIVVGDGNSANVGSAAARPAAVVAAARVSNTPPANSGQPQAPAAATITRQDSDAQRLAYAGLGAIGGAIAVAAAYRARSLRRS